MKTGGNGISALVPVKRLDFSKSRLADVLNPLERAALMEAMLGDVLDVLVNSPRLDKVLVVSNDQRVAEMCGWFDVDIAADEADTGMNSAVLAGLARLSAAGYRGALVVPADVPYISLADIDNAVVTLDSAKVVLAKADRDGGTNLLGMAPIDLIAPCYGPDSLAKHLYAARATGTEPIILSAMGVGRDIDVPADLEPFDRGGPAPRTRLFLARTCIEAASAT